MVMGHVDLRESEELRRRLSVECNIEKDSVIPPTIIFQDVYKRQMFPFGIPDGEINRIKYYNKTERQRYKNMGIKFTSEDWARIGETYDKWWSKELDRPVIKLTLQKEYRYSGNIPMLAQDNCHRLAISAEDVVERINLDLENQEYYGDAFPMFNFDVFGPGLVGEMCIRDSLSASTIKVCVVMCITYGFRALDVYKRQMNGIKYRPAGKSKRHPMRPVVPV